MLNMRNTILRLITLIALLPALLRAQAINAGGSINPGPIQQPVTKLIAGTGISLSPTTGIGIVTVTGTGGPPTGAAGGVLTGTYPNPGLAVTQTINTITSATGQPLTLGALDGNNNVILTPSGTGTNVLSKVASDSVTNSLRIASTPASGNNGGSSILFSGDSTPTSKVGIFYQRTAANSVGSLIFALNGSSGTTTQVSTSDAILTLNGVTGLSTFAQNVLIASTSTLKFGATAAATIGVTADTSAGAVKVINPGTGGIEFDFLGSGTTGILMDNTGSTFRPAGSVNIPLGSPTDRWNGLYLKSTSFVSFGGTSDARINVSADTTAADLVFTGTSTGAVTIPSNSLLIRGASTASGTYGLEVRGPSPGNLPARFTMGNVNGGTVSFYDANNTTERGVIGFGANALSASNIADLVVLATGQLKLCSNSGIALTLDTSQNALFANKITSYNGVATAGWGVPAIQKAGRVTAQVAANASISTYTVGAADGSFEVSGNVNVTTATAHSFSMTCTYTDEGNTSRTLTLGFAQLSGATLITLITNVTGAGPYESLNYHIRCKAGTAITFATTGTFTTVTYNAEGIIRQLQ